VAEAAEVLAQDTAKRRALGRVLASAAGETGTRVDDELLFIRVLADLDPPHIRCLRIMATEPPHLDAINRQRQAVGEPAVRQWHPSDIASQDPGLETRSGHCCPSWPATTSSPAATT
jgi:hypothetical protein